MTTPAHQNLVRATATQRSTGTTCQEARARLLFFLPDTVPFQSPLSWALRFGCKRDIIVLSVLSPIGMREVVEWIARTGISPLFENVRNLAFDSGTLAEFSKLGRPGAFCYCEPSECAFCKGEPLPAFLACFPRLETLPFAALGSRWWKPSSTIDLFAHPLDPVPRCACPVVNAGATLDRLQPYPITGRWQWPPTETGPGSSPTPNGATAPSRSFRS